MAKPEQQARENIDRALCASGWIVQDVATANLSAGRGVAIREFPLMKGHGFADYLLFVDSQAVGAVEDDLSPTHRALGCRRPLHQPLQRRALRRRDRQGSDRTRHASSLHHPLGFCIAFCETLH